MNNKTKRTSRNTQKKQGRQYDPDDYLNNRAMIQLLIDEHKEIKEKYETIELKLEESQNLLRKQELQTEIASLKFKQIEKDSVADFIRNISVTLLFGIGLNLATTFSQISWLGWLLIILSIALEAGHLLQKSRKGN